MFNLAPYCVGTGAVRNPAALSAAICTEAVSREQIEQDSYSSILLVLLLSTTTSLASYLHSCTGTLVAIR